MDVREKLVELLAEFYGVDPMYHGVDANALADHLIDNGVTVHEWISVCDEQKEIWADFFPNVPPTIARDVALVSAESVKLSNYCPNCGAKMDGGSENG